MINYLFFFADSFLQQLKTFDTRRTLRLHAVPDPNVDVRHYASRRKSVIVPPIMGTSTAGYSPAQMRHPSISSAIRQARSKQADRRESLLNAEDPQSRSNIEVALIFGTGADADDGI